VDTQRQIPFYAKATLILVGLFAFTYAMYIGQHIIIPLLYGTIIAILLNPIVSYLEKKGINKIIAIFISVLVAIVVVLVVFYIIFSQWTMFSETYPQLKEKFNQTSYDLLEWLSGKFDIRKYKITAWWKENRSDAIDNIAYGAILSAGGRVVLVGVLLPVYVFMILYYKTLLLEFSKKLFSSEHHVAVAEVLANTKKIIQSYLVGLLFEMIIIAILNSAGLLLLGVDYAIILGITGAILNIIPYIGGIIAIALPMIIAFITKDSLTCSLLVFCVYLIIQFVDNHFIIPKIVASRVKINALISVIVVLIGGAIWGIAGMFLSIPLTAIVKVIFDHIEPLKPWGFLLGDTMPTASNLKLKLKNISARIINN
jgi:predicted PurR-regulated permease PerM